MESVMDQAAYQGSITSTFHSSPLSVLSQHI